LGHFSRFSGESGKEPIFAEFLAEILSQKGSPTLSKGEFCCDKNDSQARAFSRENLFILRWG
jgi:hypothetical protein